MNRFLYTLLVAAVSVGITLALAAACNRNCVCDDSSRDKDAGVIETVRDGEEATGGSDNSGAGTSSGRNAIRTGNGNARDSLAGGPRRKYGDAETGGNVYTIGGVSPGSEATTLTNTNSSGTTNGGGTSSSKPRKQNAGNDGNQRK